MTRVGQILGLVGSLALLCLALAQTSGCDATPISLPGQPQFGDNDRGNSDAPGNGEDLPSSGADAGVGAADAGAVTDGQAESRDAAAGDQGPTDGGADGEPDALEDGGEGDTAGTDADGLIGSDGDLVDGM